jgi:hypothetical protein
MTTPSFYRTTGLSIHLFTPVIDTTTTPVTYNPRGQYVGSITAHVDSWTHTTARFGGFWKAGFSINSRFDGLEEWVDKGIGGHIEVYGPDQVVVWEGFVDKINGTVGSFDIDVGPLMNVANEVTAAYTDRDTTTTPPTTSSRTATAAAASLDSQGRYGLIEGTLSAGSIPAAQAEQARDLYLEENAYPTTTGDLRNAGGDSVSLSVKCGGYFWWLKSYPYNQVTTSGTVDLSDKIRAILDNQRTTAISANYSRITPNAFQVEAWEDKSKDAYKLVQDLVQLGDADNNVYNCGVYGMRQMVYEPLPMVPQYQWLISDSGQAMRTLAGAEVPPWSIRPGVWVTVADFGVSYQWTPNLRRMKNAVLVEQVTYTAPFGLSIKGGKVETVKAAINRFGLGGVS